MESFSRIKRFLAESRSYFAAYSEELTQDERQLLRRMTVLYLACLLIYLLVICPLQGNVLQTSAVTAAITFHIVLTIIAQTHITSTLRGFRVTVAVFGVEILSLAMFLGVFAFPNTPALLFPLILVLMTQIYTLPPRSTLSLIGAAWLLFLLLSFAFKPIDAFWQDLLSSTVAAAISLVAHYSQLRYKLDFFAMRQSLQHMCSVDRMTGVLNKTTFEYYVSEFLRTQNISQGFALGIVDLDRFKDINDQYGHKRGDDLLLKFSDLMKELYPEEHGYIGRFGGDEFVVFLKNADSVQQVHEMFQILLDTLNQADWFGQPVSCSIGATFVAHEGPNYAQVFLSGRSGVI
jgi:diguanylate cyclase (GGDEF)-like protein